MNTFLRGFPVARAVFWALEGAADGLRTTSTMANTDNDRW
jgi:hypothetical protein